MEELGGTLGVTAELRRLVRCRYIEIATRGRTTDGEDGEEFDGFLWTIYQNLDRDAKLLQQACDETGFLASLRAALLVVQNLRFDPKERSASRPRRVLRQWADLLGSTISECHLDEPPADGVQRALTRYGVLTPADIDRLLPELTDWARMAIQIAGAAASAPDGGKVAAQRRRRGEPRRQGLRRGLDPSFSVLEIASGLPSHDSGLRQVPGSLIARENLVGQISRVGNGFSRLAARMPFPLLRVHRLEDLPGEDGER
jgi:hypothetical protein